MKVRRVTKNVCKLHTKRVRLNKVAQHEKKYLLNCSVRIYQRIIKLKYLSHMFSCNKPMCLYKRQTHVSNYCKFQLSSDIEKNPGPTPVYIDPSKTITAPASLCPLIYNNKQGINSANHLVSIMNIQENQLYSSLSQLTGQSFLMQTELPTFEADYELQYSESYNASRQK